MLHLLPVVILPQHNMLADYRAQRQAANNVYGQNLAQEHQFAYQQLAQQMQEAQMKAIPENADKGTLGLIMSAYPGIAGQASPDVINSTLDQLATNQGAKNLQASGQGFRDFSTGGALLNPNMLPGVPHNSVLQLTDDDRVRVENIKAAVAAAKNAIEKKPMTTVTQPGIQIGDVPAGGYSSRVPDDQVDATTAKFRARVQADRDAANAQARPTSPTQPGGATSLQQNPNAPKAAAPAQAAPTQAEPVPLSTVSKTGAAAQNAAKLAMDAASKATDPAVQAQFRNIDAARKGAVYPVVQTANGAIALQGADKKLYRIPGM